MNLSQPDANDAGSHCIDYLNSFTAVRAPTEGEEFWPFGPTDEPADTTGLFGSFGGVSGEKTGDSPMLKEEPAQRLGFREHIFGGLTSMTHALVMVANIHSLWLSFGNSLHARVIRNTYKYGQPEIIRGIIGTEDGSTLTVGRTARSTTDCSNCLLYTSPSPRDGLLSRMPSSA